MPLPRQDDIEQTLRGTLDRASARLVSNQKSISGRRNRRRWPLK
jgi:hypothetical protein